MSIPYFHEGERQVQAESGSDTPAYEANAALAMTPELVAHEIEFIESRTFSMAASVDADGRPWASPLITPATGDVFTVRGETTIDIAPAAIEGDPLAANVAASGSLGVLFFQPETRRRAKSLGSARLLNVSDADGPAIRYEQTRYFGLCPKYIVKRSHDPDPRPAVAKRPIGLASTALSAADVAQISSSDTNFLASFHPGHGADVTHRGGQPGFVHVIDDTTLDIPDFFGNGMFNTLGNLVLDNRLALTDVDFETGRTIQITGRASVTRDVDTARYGDVERVIRLTIDDLRVVHAPIGSWSHIEASRYSSNYPAAVD